MSKLCPEKKANCVRCAPSTSANFELKFWTICEKLGKKRKIVKKESADLAGFQSKISFGVSIDW